MDFEAYDDYTDPVLDCGHRSSTQCGCYAPCDGCDELYLVDEEEWVEIDNKYYCETCAIELEGEDE